MSEQLIKTPGTFGENGNFLLERELGSGGMGGVYMGRDKMLDRPVAVKVMLKEYGDDAEFVERFKKEAQACARLIHPNIAQVYSYGISDGMPYIAMELVAGGSLWTLMQQNKGHTDVTRVLKICQQVAQALQCASDQGFVHGDIKPENILLDSNGNAKIVDFGLAAMQKETDEIWGTPYYISPEKVKKEPVDFRTDMYSLGGTLYHALTGVAPFEGDDAVAVVKKRFEGAPKKPSEIRPDLTPQIDTLVLRMLELQPDKRYPSFEALIEEFKKVLTTGLSADGTAPAGDAKPAAAKPATGARPAGKSGGRVMMRSPRRMKPMMKKKSVDPDAEAGEDANVPDIPAVDDEEDEEGGNLGKKVMLAVVGGIALIGGVIGFLVWYQIHDKAVREQEHVAQVANNIDSAFKAIANTRDLAVKFADEFDTFANRAVEEVKKPTDLLKGLLPDFADMMNVPPTKELLDAIASTNPPPEVVAAPPVAAASTNAPAAAQPAGTNAAPAQAAPAQPAPAPAAKDAKPAAPAAKEAAPAAKEAPPAAKEEAPAEPAAPPKDVPNVVNDIIDLWGRAYSCQASAVRIRHGVRKILAVCEEAEAVKDRTDEAMTKLGEYSRNVKEMLDELKASKDVENVRKGITFIKSKGQKLVKQTEEKLRIEKLEAERKAKAEKEAADEAARLKAAEEARLKAIEDEKLAIDEKFKSENVQKLISLLDWASAIKQLELVKANFKTPEGQLAANMQIRKVRDMQLVQNIFVLNIKGHLFRANKKDASTIKNFTVTEVDSKLIQLIGPDHKTKKKLTWRKFYQSYHGNLNELIIKYIEKGKGQYRAEEKGAKMGLAKWSEAMLGAALTMQLICSDDGSAATRAESIVKTAVKQFEESKRIAAAMFPDMKFDEAPAEE